MKVKLATAVEHPCSLELRAEVEGVIRLDHFGKHVLAGDVEEADLILVVDLHRHPGVNTSTASECCGSTESGRRPRWGLRG